ncbi:Uracil permease [Pleurostoma richardsiae]|uniref:Uracil permease n=1 Tax=Pleurostoma richardsiae TaxID=41990 RepID=A0AA38VNZ4_9PEZI|nr:Uracil permease [Pleurostoma richardsiae]
MLPLNANSASLETIRSKLYAGARTVKLRSTSLESWKLPKQSSTLAPDYVWSNPDQDPVPKEKQTWTAWTFVGYWFSDLFTVAGWQAASSALLLGLGTTDAILVALVAGICNAVPTVLNGAIGSQLHIPFPIAIRASFGYWFSYFAVITRCILALFWFSIQGYGGASAVAAVITAIWPSFATLPNHLPDNAGTTTQMMVAYVVYNAIQFPLLIIPTHKLQALFLAKAILVPPMVIAMTVWSCRRASGTGAIFSIQPTVSGSERAWLWLSTMTSVTGGYSTLAVNIPDFSRFSRTPNAQFWQLPLIPFFKVFTSIFGIICTGASLHIYGSYIWNPLTIVSSWGSTPGGRFAAFVCACIWLLAQLCCNISANSVSFANDVTTLLPRYFNIRRGVVFASVVGAWALVPWKIQESASSLLSFMSGYAVVLGPFAGIMCCDFWLVRRGRLDVAALYDPKGRYVYNKYGTNWRAFLIVFSIVGPLLPGLAHAINSSIALGKGLQHLYSINWLFGFFASIVIYYILMTIFPARNTMMQDVEVLEGIDSERGYEHANPPGVNDKGMPRGDIISIAKSD